MADNNISQDVANADGKAASSDPTLSTAPSTSVLSDAPMSEPAAPGIAPHEVKHATGSGDDSIQVAARKTTASVPHLDGSTNASTNGGASNGDVDHSALGIGLTEFEAARAKMMNDMSTTQAFEQASQLQTDASQGPAPKPKNRIGRPRKRASLLTHGAPANPMANTAQTAPTPSTSGRARGVGRGRGGGRPRGRGAASSSSKRGGKRKRADDDENASVSLSDSSDEVVETTTQTKSGRAVQKPTSFVPPPNPSPSADKPVKRRRAYHRNPQSAVCKVCLRGTSPDSNMIVFCDGCNTPWHQYCHHPPISKAMIEQVDAEWFCKQCTKERAAPVSEASVEAFVAADGASAEERKRYFASLQPGLMVTLLTRATTLHPDLPLFSPSFHAQRQQPETNGAMRPPLKNSLSSSYPMPTPTTTTVNTSNHHDEAQEEEDDATYGSDVHPPHYPKPGYGLMATLPPDDEDETLVDDKNSLGVFSHFHLPDAEVVGEKQAGDKDQAVAEAQQEMLG